jgi:hypothetical protein
MKNRVPVDKAGEPESYRILPVYNPVRAAEHLYY